MKRDYPGLELSEDHHLHHRAVVLQRLAWGALLALVVAGLLGFFGTGPLSSATARTSAGCIIDYDRFGRTQTPQTMRIRMHASRAPTLWLSNELTESLAIEGMFPPPVSAIALADGLQCTFAPPDAEHNADEFVVQLQLRPAGPGVVRSSIGVSPGDAASLWQLIYP